MRTYMSLSFRKYSLEKRNYKAQRSFDLKPGAWILQNLIKEPHFLKTELSCEVMHDVEGKVMHKL